MVIYIDTTARGMWPVGHNIHVDAATCCATSGIVFILHGKIPARKHAAARERV